MIGDDKIFVPYNESTKHIYDTVALVAGQIYERARVDPAYREWALERIRAGQRND